MTVKPGKESSPDRDLLIQLERATTDLHWYSEAEYPWQVFYWHDAATFSTDSLLQVGNYAPETSIVIQELSSFFENATTVETWHNEAEKLEAQRYRQLIELLTCNLCDINVYLLGTIEIDAYVLGRTKHHAIAGLTTKIVAT